MDVPGWHWRRLAIPWQIPLLIPTAAELLAQGKVVGWFQGRIDFGPRPLGARSILGDPRNDAMQSVMNLKIKYRESFRPFAPSVLADQVSDWFDLDVTSPYMLLVAQVKRDKLIPTTSEHPVRIVLNPAVQMS